MTEGRGGGGGGGGGWLGQLRVGVQPLSSTRRRSSSSASGGIFTLPALSSTSPAARPGAAALPDGVEEALGREQEVLHYGLGLVRPAQQGVQQSLSPDQARAAWEARGRRLLFQLGPGLSTDLVVGCTSSEAPGNPAPAPAPPPPGTRVLDGDLVSLHLECMPAYRRSFLVATASTFCYLQSRWEQDDMAYVSGDFEERQRFLAKVSRAYRKNMADYLAELERVHAPNLGEARILPEIYVLQAIKAVWGLVEAIYITCDRRLGECHFALSLRTWIIGLNRSLQEDQFPFLMRLPDPSENEQFWPFILHALAHGHTQAMVTLLQRVPETGRPGSAMHVLAKLVRKMPTFQKVQSDYLKALQAWQQECKLQAMSKTLTCAPKHRARVRAVLDVLSGSAEAILAEYEDWLEALLMLGTFHHPAFCDVDVAELLPLVQGKFVDPSLLDQIYMALLHSQPLEALVLCAQIDPWLIAHLNDLLTKLGITEVDEVSGFFSSECTYREWHLLLLVERAVSVPGAFVPALRYLAYCPTRGRSYLQRILLHLPPSLSREEEQEALSFAQDQGLDVRPVLALLGRRQLAVDLGQAVQYLVWAQDAAALDALVRRVLSRFTSGQDTLEAFLAFVDALDNEALHAHAGLLFLARYADILRCREEEPPEAAAKLVALISSSIVPPCFLDVLLLDMLHVLQAVPIENGAPSLLGVQGIYELMRCLEGVLATGDSKGGRKRELEDMRCYLTQHLGPAILHE